MSPAEGLHLIYSALVMPRGVATREIGYAECVCVCVCIPAQRLQCDEN